MKLLTVPYLEQTARWPARGRHILAQHDADSIIVYQSYRPSIARAALAAGHFISAAAQLRSDELDQAELPLDDVPLGLGDQEGSEAEDSSRPET